MKHSNPVKKPRSLRLAEGVAASLSTAMLLPWAAMAQTAPPQDATVLPTVTVQDQAIDPNPNAEVGAPYKAKTSADVRHTRPLAETPQTISVVTKAAIDDSGFTDLKQILAAQPGITLGTGENGNAFGDRYIIRGQEARSDVFVDGLRDPGMTTRESFAIEQLEITKGPNSTFAGRGSAGGAINAITKQATLDYDFSRISVGAGSDGYRRATLDANKGFSDQFALRANALYSTEGVPDRDPSKRRREGLALSGLWEANANLSVTLDYYGLRARDKYPDLGSYLLGTVPNRVPATGVPVYAQSQDFLNSDVDALTARVKWRIAPDKTLTSLTRYGTSDNGYVVTGASGGTRYSNGTPFTSASLSTHNGWQEVKYFAHQTNLRWDTEIAGKKNELIFGLEYTDHQVTRGNYAVTNTGAFNCRTQAGTGANTAYCLSGPSGAVTPGLNSIMGRQIAQTPWANDWQVKSFALSAMDTVDLTDQWTVFGGVRADYTDFSLVTRNATTAAQTGNYSYTDTLLNGHLGVSYKINPMGIVYASYGSAQDINGGESDTGTSSGYGGLVVYNGSAAGAKPETSRNLEIGTKWNLLDNKLLFTAAAFQTTKSDVMEGANYDSLGTFNTGKNRVRGVEFGLVGNVTSQFTVQAGVAFMKSKVLKSATAANVGLPLSNFADRSFSVQGKYQLTPALSVGATARHESDRCGGQPDTGASYTNGTCAQPVPSFTVYDLFASYRLNKHADIRVNVLNAGDKDYYTAVYRSGSFLYKGDGRAVRVTLDYEF
ncbi:TonB-dependent receptor [Acidovorax sp. SUPP950]|uniref:TonB-dependent receptor n=1 Tax=Acidovorax sp. SUPP950 TaxID=511901 RepID=UPI0023D33B6F|nr:TonB-dependent receptor [Acidovorax sp. SUPP950]GKS75163.1 TonB-dependent receptor [Acidovorax sp. SUPP950]